MELVGFAASGSGSISAGLGTQSGVKNKCSVGPQSHSASYKKPKKPMVVDGLVESSAGVSNVMDESVDSVSGISDLDNLENVVAEETSYAESDVSGLDDDMNDVTPRKTCTRTYVLNSKPPPLSFNVLSDGKDILPLPSSKFCGSNRLPPVRSRALEKRSFNSSKSFALDIELSAVPGKTVSDKLIYMKKIFYQVDGFKRALTPLKFLGIIKSLFTSEQSLIKARVMAISKKILVNDDLRKVNSRSDREVIIKEIPVDLPKLAIETVFSKFGKIISIKVQLIGLWQKALVEYESSEIADLVTVRWSVLMEKDSVHIAKASVDKQTWVSRDQHRALLYTLPVGTTAHDLSALVEPYAGLSLASCAHCKLFGHTAVDCSVGRRFGGRGKRVATSQDRKQAPIVCPVFFGGKTWAQVADSSPSRVVSSSASGVGLISGSKVFSMDPSSSGAADLGSCLAVLECSMEILSDQVLLILKKLSFIDLVSLAPSPSALSLVSPTAVVSDMDSGLALDSTLLSSASSPPNVGESIVDLSPSSSKVLTAKVGSLESNIVALEFATCNVQGINVPAKQADVVRWHVNSGNMVFFITETKLRSSSGPWLKNKFDGVRIFSSGLDKGFMGAGVAIVMNISLACHVSKSKLSVTVLGLYAGASSRARFGQTSEVNSLIAKAVNSSNFVILGGDFNENGSG
ncbi:hypothetical protein G9A89_017697 [Geosiphon pyriformis]|nr:hypothetical protein G9A89_017697 [Geosiphon pyriformis]